MPFDSEGSNPGVHSVSVKESPLVSAPALVLLPVAVTTLSILLLRYLGPLSASASFSTLRLSLGGSYCCLVDGTAAAL